MRHNIVTLFLEVTCALCLYAVALPVLEGKAERDIIRATSMSSRSEKTCADPSLARTLFEGYSSAITAHALNFHHNFITVNTAAGTSIWILQGPAFRAWPTQQPFTVPLWGMATLGSTDSIFVVGADTQTPPVVSGFSPTGIIAWVYNTPICGSVPLMSTAFPAQTDHYYTIDPDEHAGLLTDGGWSDSGVVAFVLPLS